MLRSFKWLITSSVSTTSNKEIQIERKHFVLVYDPQETGLMQFPVAIEQTWQVIKYNYSVSVFISLYLCFSWVFLICDTL